MWEKIKQTWVDFYIHYFSSKRYSFIKEFIRVIFNIIGGGGGGKALISTITEIMAYNK